MYLPMYILFGGPKPKKKSNFSNFFYEFQIKIENFYHYSKRYQLNVTTDTSKHELNHEDQMNGFFLPFFFVFFFAKFLIS
jgi:hypothetical protein